MIKIVNLTKRYNSDKFNQVVALDNFNMELFKGETINIIGKSGSGKTTLANILLGITKCDSGTFEINGIEYNSKSKRKKLRLITNTLLSSFQYPTHQLFTTTVKDELLFGNDDETKLKEMIETFSFDEDFLNRNPFKLSSGQKRKVILMSLLMSNPEILIFDEATAFLDAASRREFIDLVKMINKKYNTTMIFISHNLIDAQSFSDRTLLIEDGKLINDGNTKDVINEYLGGDVNGKH